MRHSQDRYLVARRQRPVGVTLLELILALALTVVVVLSITMALDLYWRAFDVRRTNVEEAQLARSLLRHMSDDLRSAMQYSAADLTGLEAVTQNAASGALAAAAGGAGDGGSSDDEDGSSDDNGGKGSQSPDSQPPSGSGKSGSEAPGGGKAGSDQDSMGDDGGASSATGGSTGAAGEETSTEEATTTTVGLYGGPLELRIDVSRLPRVDQYESLLAADGNVDAVDIPSDVKTVTYFLRSEESAAAADAPLGSMATVQISTTGRGRGLMRREVDRAVASWAEQSGDTQSATAQSKLLADEVVGLTFQYFDGTQWLADWNSDDLGGLPLAVEIVLVLSDARPEDTTSSLQPPEIDEKPPTERTYRLVVALPTATLPTTSTETTETEGTTPPPAEGAMP